VEGAERSARAREEGQQRAESEATELRRRCSEAERKASTYLEELRAEQKANAAQHTSGLAAPEHPAVHVEDHAACKGREQYLEKRIASYLKEKDDLLQKQKELQDALDACEEHAREAALEAERLENAGADKGTLPDASAPTTPEDQRLRRELDQVRERLRDCENHGRDLAEENQRLREEPERPYNMVDGDGNGGGPRGMYGHPDKYAGDKGQWKTWKLEVTDKIEGDDMIYDTADKVTRYVRTRTTGEVREYLEGYTRDAADNTTESALKGILDFLEVVYGDRLRMERARDQFARLQQGSMSPATYYHKFMLVAREAGVTDATRLLSDFEVKMNATTRAGLGTVEHTSLASVLRAIEILELRTPASSRYQGKRTEHARATQQSGDTTYEKVVHTAQKKIADMSTQELRDAGIHCFYCERLGHIQEKCRQREADLADGNHRPGPPGRGITPPQPRRAPSSGGGSDNGGNGNGGSRRSRTRTPTPAAGGPVMSGALPNQPAAQPRPRVGQREIRGMLDGLEEEDSGKE
jgi:hypothetical protein